MASGDMDKIHDAAIVARRLLHRISMNSHGQTRATIDRSDGYWIPEQLMGEISLVQGLLNDALGVRALRAGECDFLGFDLESK